jgi:FMN phosphatase YigB (HAD superfamily)
MIIIFASALHYARIIYAYSKTIFYNRTNKSSMHGGCMKRTVLINLLLLATCATAPISAELILFDLGGVLITYSKRKIGQTAGIGQWIRYLLCDHINPLSLRSMIFDILHTVRQYIPRTTDCPALACDDQGFILPLIFCELQSGITPAHELLSDIRSTITQLTSLNYFISDDEQQIARNVIERIFSPELFVAHLSPLKSGMRLLAQCANIKNADGTPKHTIGICSNFDPESFEFLMDTPIGQQILQYVPPDLIFISGHYQSHRGLKPNHTAFEAVIEKTGFAAEDIVFIDDQDENLRAAAICGMNTIKFNGRRSLKGVRTQLRRRGII